MVAAVCSWHEHHDPAARELERRLARRETLIIAAPALVEAYAVLSRLPPPHRLSAHDARTLLETNFLSGTKLIALNGRDYRAVFDEAPVQGVTGGRTYDWVIAVCARKARASVLLTFNVRDFGSFAVAGLEVRSPDAAAV
jgi:predicted nucleic acid-binding protein